MNVVDRIVAEAREAKRRKEAALSAVLALPRDQQREVLADLILHIEAQETGAPAAATISPSGESGTFTQRAETFVLAHPEGVRTRDVSEAIGQDVSAVDGTLRILLKRGRVRREGRLWLPSGTDSVPFSPNPNTPSPRRDTIRDKIRSVYANNRNSPIGAYDLFEALKRLDPAINRASVDGEMNRMRKDGLLDQEGTGSHGGGLYRLTEASTPK